MRSPTLLDDPARREAMGRAAMEQAPRAPRHRSRGRTLDRHLRRLVARMTPLLVIRHGTTDWNAAGASRGAPTARSTTTGRAAIRAAVLPPGWADAPCLASPLKRAMETAHLLGLHPIPEPRLIEMAWGEWEGRRLTELRAELGDAMRENEARGLDFRPPGGESPREVQERLHPAARETRRRRPSS